MIKKEVRELCEEFVALGNGARWKEIEYELTHKWKFTPFNLLALFGKHPTIEFNDKNFSLVWEEERPDEGVKE